MGVALISFALLVAVFLPPALLLRVTPGFIANGFLAPFWRPILLVLAVIGLATRSFVIIDQNEVGHLNRIYLGADLAPGQIVALDGQKGPQARILGPGFHFIFLVRVLYEVETASVIEIKEGHYGLLLAKDGLPLRDGQFMADEWPQDKQGDMMEAAHFLTEGKGQKGPQLSVLKPGRYRLNRYLFEVKEERALDVPTGSVAVVRANVATTRDCPDPLAVSKETGLAMPVVPRGCVGVWSEPLPPGRYYLNTRAYVPTLIPTLVQVWTYKGGYSERRINLTVDTDGSIKQEVKEQEIPVPQEAADRAINVRVEGWTFPVEMRVVAQVSPQNAPRVVASVGDMRAVEDKIVTPVMRDVLRTLGGRTERKVMDFVQNRDVLVKEVEDAVAIEALKAGVSIQEVRMGEPAIPPELMVATLRQQLATQLQATFKQEKQAQEERVKVEREKATATQQSKLVEAEIAKNAAEHRKEQLRLEGEGEKLKLIEIAAGQKQQAQVLGEERVMQLEMLKQTLAAAERQPGIVKVPQVQVLGSGGGLEGAAAVLGSSNLVQSLSDAPKPKK